MNHSTTTLRDRLRCETKESHARLDLIIDDLSPFDSALGYRIYLKGLFSLYSIYGDAIDWTSEMAGIDPTAKELQSAIKNDLNGTIDMKVAATQQVNVIHSVNLNWAAGYVMEGSAMGARMITGLRANSIGVPSECRRIAPGSMGCSYLLKLAGDSFDRWPAFVTAMKEADCDDDLVVEEAKSVFCVAENVFRDAIASEI